MRGREGTVQMGGRGSALHSQAQIQLVPLRGVDQVMTWGLLD